MIDPVQLELLIDTLQGTVQLATRLQMIARGYTPYLLLHLLIGGFVNDFGRHDAESRSEFQPGLGLNRGKIDYVRRSMSRDKYNPGQHNK